MPDSPHKTGGDSLAELNRLSLETRRHIHGLFERLTEGIIILVLQLFLATSLVGAFPNFFLPPRSGWHQCILFLYIAFSIGWTTRSVYEIRTATVSGFTPTELKEGDTYNRYCMGGWFLKTLGVLILVTAIAGCSLLFL